MAEFQNPQQEPGMERRLLLVFALTFVVIILFQPILKKYFPQSQAPAPAQQTQNKVQTAPQPPSPSPVQAAAMVPVLNARATEELLPSNAQLISIGVALSAVARILARASVEALLVKGAALGLTVYPEPAARPMTSMRQHEPSSVAMLETSAAISMTVAQLYFTTEP